MGTTPLWVPLAVAAIAVIGTLAGVIFTQTWNSRLEERRWARENDRLREAQAREDKNRTYEHRRAAYVEFQQEVDRLVDLLHSDPLLFDHDMRLMSWADNSSTASANWRDARNADWRSVIPSYVMMSCS